MVEQEFVEIGMEVMELMDVVINVVVKILYLGLTEKYLNCNYI